jgi:hypothetical protein
MRKYTKIVEVNGSRYRVMEDGTMTKVAEFRGNSKRNKPKSADGVLDGDELWEYDTGDVYVFDADIDDWHRVFGNSAK